MVRSQRSLVVLFRPTQNQLYSRFRTTLDFDRNSLERVKQSTSKNGVINRNPPTFDETDLVNKKINCLMFTHSKSEYETDPKCKSRVVDRWKLLGVTSSSVVINLSSYVIKHVSLFQSILLGLKNDVVFLQLKAGF